MAGMSRVPVNFVTASRSRDRNASHRGAEVVAFSEQTSHSHYCHSHQIR